jgi:Flp pilus assembly protein, pilin Flp
MKKMLRRLFADRRADDLMEYALLAAFLGLATVLAFQLMGTNMRDAYQSWDTATQDRWDLNADLTPASSSGP